MAVCKPNVVGPYPSNAGDGGRVGYPLPTVVCASELVVCRGQGHEGRKHREEGAAKHHRKNRPNF